LISKGLMKVLQRRGWNLDEICLSFIGYEGGKAHVARQKKIVKDIVGRHGGIGVGKGPGALYDQKKCDTGYIRDFLLDRGAIGDVSDSAAPWSKLLLLYRNVMAAADKVYAELGVQDHREVTGADHFIRQDRGANDWS
jgi:alkyldihydroxyacetonephosphate synthase